MSVQNQTDDLWLKVAIEIKKTANGSTGMRIKTIQKGYHVLETDKAVIRMVDNGDGLTIRSADFNDGSIWQASDGENAKIIAELSDGEKLELQRNFGIKV
jgi:hypothetical protein